MLIQRTSGRSLGCWPSVTLACWLQPVVETERQQAGPSQSTAQPGARCSLAHKPTAPAPSSLPQPGRRVAGVIRAPLCGHFHHGGFAAHVVGGDRLLAFLAQMVDHIQLGPARLRHQDVGPIALIEFGFDQGFAAVGRIHLIGALVLGDGLAATGTGGGIEGLAEGAVVGGGVLSSVADDAHIREALGAKRFLDRAHPAIHHVARTHQIGPSPGHGQGKGVSIEPAEDQATGGLASGRPDRLQLRSKAALNT